MPGFVPKDWHDSPTQDTPTSAAAFEDMEVRVTNYADTGGLVGRQSGYTTAQYYACCETVMNGLGGTGTQTVDRGFFSPFWIYVTRTFDRIACAISANGTAGSLTRLGIYNDNSGVPGTVLLDAGTVATDAGAPAIKAITISQQLTPGRYWAVSVPQVASPSYRRASPVSAMVYLNGTFDGIAFVADGISGALGNNPSISSVSIAPNVVALRA